MRRGSRPNPKKERMDNKNNTTKAVAREVGPREVHISLRVASFGMDLIWVLVTDHIAFHEVYPGFNLSILRVEGEKEDVVVLSDPTTRRVTIAFKSEIDEVAAKVMAH